MKTLTLLIDAEMFVYATCSAVETETNWGDDLYTLHVNLDEAKAKLIDKLDYVIGRVLTKYPANDAIRYQTLFCLSDTENFRKKISPTYKLNRAKKRKPVGYAALIAWLKASYHTSTVRALEADDLIGILATKPYVAHIPVIVSGDKDLKSIPGLHYNFLTDEMTTITAPEAYRWFLTQALTGDPTDGYHGCPGVGIKTAEKLLHGSLTWDTVVKTYQKHGLSKDDALREARLARILHYKDYDHEKGEVILWTPPEDPSLKLN